VSWRIAIAAALLVQPNANEPFTIVEVGPRVFAAIENRAAPASSGANAGFVIGDDGVIVVDTFANAEAAAELLAEIRRRTPLPIKWAINTHHHVDHVLGNAVFAGAGVAVLAQRNVRDWIHSENLHAVEVGYAAEHQTVPPEVKAAITAFVAPTTIYDRGVDLRLGSRLVQVRHVLGHTGGDSIVLVPDANVVFAGDIVWRRNVPNLVDASTPAWIAALDNLIARHRGATFVPGHGGVATATDVVAFRDYLRTLRRLVSAARARKQPAVDFALPRLKARYGPWDYFNEMAPANIGDVAAELAGTKRVPAAIH
jgi:glyoxylase-like metal-dependent hydrolase (beta-lactamase superfamily II)